MQPFRSFLWRFSDRLIAIIAVFLLSLPVQANTNTNANAWQTHSIHVAEAEISWQLLAASAPRKARLLWLPSEYGLLPQEKRLAERLSHRGIESWTVDFYEALFAAPTPSALERIPTAWVKTFIDRAAEDGVPVWIVAANRAAKLALQGLVSRAENGAESAPGVILLNPNLYVQTPQPGEAAVYWPQVDAANLSVSIFQSELSPWRWRLAELGQRLEKGGSDVFIRLLPKVRDRFYFRGDSMGVERQAALKLEQQILTAMRLQLPYLSQPRPLLNAEALRAKAAVTEKKASLSLLPYRGDQALQLKLFDLQNRLHDLDALKGKVVLVNFWASWCPPCVHEMPSMADLKRRYPARDFEILAVNLGEEARAIDAFKAEHPVNFPILLDQHGEAVKAWKIFAYPSSYVVDRKGEIRYALFGATDWMAQDTVQKIDALLNEAP